MKKRGWPAVRREDVTGPAFAPTRVKPSDMELPSRVSDSYKTAGHYIKIEAQFMMAVGLIAYDTDMGILAQAFLYAYKAKRNI